MIGIYYERQACRRQGREEGLGARWANSRAAKSLPSTRCLLRESRSGQQDRAQAPTLCTREQDQGALACVYMELVRNFEMVLGELTPQQLEEVLGCVQQMARRIALARKPPAEP